MNSGAMKAFNLIGIVFALLLVKNACGIQSTSTFTCTATCPQEDFYQESPHENISDNTKDLLNELMDKQGLTQSRLNN